MYDQKRGKIGVVIVVSLAVVTAGVIGAFHFVSQDDGDEEGGSEIAGVTDDQTESAGGGDESHESVDPATDGADDTEDDATENESETERQSTDSEGTDSTDIETDADRVRTDGGSDETTSDTGTDATGDDEVQSDDVGDRSSDDGEQSNDDGEVSDDAPDDVEYPGGMQVELVDLPPQLDTEGRTLFGVAVRSETPESGEAVLCIDGEVVDSAAYTTEANDAFDYAEGNVQLFAVDPDVEAGETYPVVIETDHGDRTFDIRAEEPLVP